MSFAVCSNIHHVGRILIVAGSVFLAACSGGKGSEKELRILGTPPPQAYLGVEYKYDVGIDGGSGIPTVSLSNAPRWMSAEYVDNPARKGVVVRGVPGISSGAGAGDLTGREPIVVGLTVYDGDNMVTAGFPILVSYNEIWIEPVEVTEGVASDVPLNAQGEPYTDCLVEAPEKESSDTIAYVPVRLLAPSVRTIVASFETRVSNFDQSARAGEDYREHKGVVSFSPGTTRCYIEVAIMDDELAEGRESFDVYLTDVNDELLDFSPSNPPRAIVGIHDNEPKVSWNKVDVVVTEGDEVTVKAVLDHAVDRLVSAEFVLIPGDTDQLQLTDQDIVVKVDGNTLSPPYSFDFQPGEKEKEIVIQVVANPDQLAGPDKQFGLAWQSTTTVLETVETLKIHVNELLSPVTLTLPAGVQVREMLTDSRSNIYVAYSGDEPGQTGMVAVFDRHGQPLTSPLAFLEGARSGYRRELTDIFIREFEGLSATEQQTIYVDLYLVGVVEENIAGHQGGTDVVIDVWRWEGSGNFKRVSPWPRQFGTQYDDVAHGIYVDRSGDIYVVGETKGQFNGGVANGGGDAFLAKYNATGGQLFAKNLTGIGTREVLVDISGNGTSRVTVTGYAEGQLYGKPQGGKDVALASYNREGRIQRGRQQGNEQDNIATTLTLMDNRILNGGYTRGQLFKDSGEYKGGEDAFVSFFPDASTHGSTVQFGTAGDDRVLDLVADGNKVFATGYASGALFPGCRHGGGRDAFLVTYDVVATSDDINRKDEVLKPGWQGEGCSASGWPIQIGTSANEQGSVLAITPSRKLLWLIEREENGGRTVEIRPYDLEGRPLIQ